MYIKVLTKKFLKSFNNNFLLAKPSICSACFILMKSVKKTLFLHLRISLFQHCPLKVAQMSLNLLPLLVVTLFTTKSWTNESSSRAAAVSSFLLLPLLLLLLFLSLTMSLPIRPNLDARPGSKSVYFVGKCSSVASLSALLGQKGRIY